MHLGQEKGPHPAPSLDRLTCFAAVILSRDMLHRVTAYLGYNVLARQVPSDCMQPLHIDIFGTSSQFNERPVHSYARWKAATINLV